MDLKELKRESVLASYMFSKAGKMKIPLSGTFELSPVCNFSCRMCYVRKTQKEVNSSPRPMLTCEQWLELARQLRDQGMLYLLLTGGEPFFWPDFWKLYSELHKMGFLISINTNGSLIDEDVIQRLKKQPPTRVNVTLYGSSDKTYENLCGAKGMFSKVDGAITGLKEAGITTKLNCSLTPWNADDLEEIVLYAQEKKLILEVATYMFPPTRRDASMAGRNERFTPKEAAYYNMKRYRLQHGEETYWKYLEKVVAGIAPPPGLDESCVDPVDGKIRCRAAKASFWITWDGWLTPCGMMGEPKEDLQKQSFAECWERLVQAGEKLKLTSVCDNCDNRRLCNSCAAVAMTETGSFSGIPRYLCEEMAAARELAKQYLEERKKL